MLAAALLATCGCAALFQEHLPSDYAGTTEPRCGTAPGWQVLDALDAAAEVTTIVLLSVANHDRTTNIRPNEREPPIAGTQAIDAVSAVAVIAHVISGVTGHGWATDCVAARERWDRGERGLPAAPKPAAAATASPSTVAPIARFCFKAVGELDGACFDDKDACEAARAGIESGTCYETTAAVCLSYDEGTEHRRLCAPNADVCGAKRDALLARGVAITVDCL